MYISSKIAEKIKEVAKAKGIPVTNMLSEIELGANTLQNMKTSMPKTDTLAKIADYLEISMDELIGRDIKKIAPIETNLDDLTEVLMQLDINELIEVREYAKLLLLRKQAQAEPTNR